jgi:hypothetical protein
VSVAVVVDEQQVDTGLAQSGERRCSAVCCPVVLAALLLEQLEHGDGVLATAVRTQRRTASSRISSDPSSLRPPGTSRSSAHRSPRQVLAQELHHAHVAGDRDHARLHALHDGGE